MNKIVSVALAIFLAFASIAGLEGKKNIYSNKYKPVTIKAPKIKISSYNSYKIGQTTYSTTKKYENGKPQVIRSSSAKKKFLKSIGLEKTPKGYEIDHITPLSKGGADAPYNMQLLSVEQHKKKTARERK